jgi:hypothetical protein
MYYGFLGVAVLLSIFASLSANACGLTVLVAISLCIGVVGMLVNCR